MIPYFPWLASYPANVNWRAPLDPLSLPTLWEAAVRDYAAQPCLDFLGKKYRYREVDQLIRRAAAGLQTLGVTKGVKVGLCLPNSPYYVIMYFAVLFCGGTVVNFNPLYAERELKHQITDSGSSVMVTLDLKVSYDKLEALRQQQLFKTLIVCPMADILPFPQNILFSVFKRAQIAAIAPDKHHVSFTDLTARMPMAAPVSVNPQQDIAVLQYTGGTTGTPKGAALTHANLSINAQQAVLWFPDARPAAEKMLAVLPFFHVFAMTAVMNFAIKLGAELILLPRFEINQLIKTIHRKRPTLFPAVPTIYTAINHYTDLAKYNLSSIRYCISGGAGLPVEVKRDFEKLTGCVLVEGYGLTETSPVASCNPVTGENRAGSIGLPFPGTIIEIVSLEDKKTVMPPGERGEVCIRGPQVMQGYYNKPAETAEVLEQTADGSRLHTGDVGIMDPDGYVRIVDRIKDMIVAGGFKIYPRHVEEAIYLHDAVEECIVAGVPDAYRGQTVKAYLKLKDGQNVTAEQLTQFLKDKLSPIEMPKQIEFRDSLPKTMIGKLNRKALLDEEAAKVTVKAP